jgi:hypothetical protein
MSLPAKRILLGLGGFVLLWLLFVLIVDGFALALGSLFILVLGAIIGPFMAIAYPFSLSFKVGYLIILLASVLAIVYGIKHRPKTLGQAAVVLGVVVWTFAGLIGLGTGS